MNLKSRRFFLYLLLAVMVLTLPSASAVTSIQSLPIILKVLPESFSGSVLLYSIAFSPGTQKLEPFQPQSVYSE